MKKFLLYTYQLINLSTVFLLTFFIACAPTRIAIKLGYDFNRIKTIGVSEFVGEGESGQVVRDEFIRQLLKKGFSVKAVSEKEPNWEQKKQEIDVLLTGSVTRYLPERKFLVYLGEKTTDQKIIVYPSLTEITGTYGYTWGRISGLEESRILITNATVGVAAKIIDLKTGEVVWADSYTYEGLDIQTALENVVRYFLHSLAKYWEQMH